MTEPVPLDRESALLAELQWFVRLRWFAGLTIIAGILVNLRWMGWTGHYAQLLAVGVGILVYNFVLWILFRQQPERLKRSAMLMPLAWSQILLDLVCLTVLTVWTGGMSSPLLGLFLLHMVFASLLLPPLASYVGAALAMSMVSIALWLSNQWPTESASLITAGGWMVTLLLTVLVANHITGGLRRQETELRRQNRHTRAVLETAADGIITIDEDEIIQSVNPAAERIFGFDRSEMIGRNVAMLMPEPYSSEHEQYTKRYLRTGISRVICVGREVVGRRKDGTTFPLDVAVSEVVQGNRHYFTGIVRDITERKESEQALTRLNEELRRQQQALLQHEKMAAMGQMAAGVAHEISNPLASMDSLLQLVHRQPDRLNGQAVDALREQVARISRIVQQMTAFAHPNETGWEVRPLNNVVQAALEMVRFDHRIRRVAVETDLSPDIGDLRMMPHAIQQVLVNLILNALDALTEAPHPVLRLTTRRDGSWSVIDVFDNGHGIAAEDLSRVFEPFFTTKPVGQGTGLGLSISYSLVERHDGRVEVRSGPDRGATFSVYLPTKTSGSDGRDGSIQSIPDSENDKN